MSRDDRANLPPKLQDLIRARDNFFLNSNSVPPDRAREFVLSTTSSCSSEENARGIACALLSLRDSSFLQDFLLYVIQTRNQFYNVVTEAVCEAVRKYFESFTKEASDNTFDIFSGLCHTNDTAFKTHFAVSLISNYDTGFMSRSNLRMIGFFTKNVVAHSDMWCELEAANCLLVIKFLRFYQDTFILQDMQQSQNLEKNLRDVLASAQSLSSEFGPAFVGFFEKSLANVVKFCFREVVRILYDPRTHRRMQARFPAIYGLVNSVKENEIIDRTASNVIQVMLPYHKMCALLDFSRTFREEDSHGARTLFDRGPPLRDQDLILSDITRVFLNSPDYEGLKPDERYRCLTVAVKKAMGQRNAIPRSFIQALINDVLYTNVSYLGVRAYQTRTLFVVLPCFLYIREIAGLGNWIVDAIMTRIAQDDHKAFKRDSLREVVNFLRRSNIMPDIGDIMLSAPQLEPAKRQELANLLRPKETDVIPIALMNFHKSGGALDSPQAHEMIKLAGGIVQGQITQNHGNLLNAAPVILRVLDTLVPRDRAHLELVFDRVHPLACALFSSRRQDDARRYLEWAYANQETSAFQEAGILKLSCFVDALRESVAEKTPLWRYFVMECPIFRTRVGLLQAICDYCSISAVMDLAELPYLPGDNSGQIFTQIFHECKNWSPDAQMRLTLFLSARLVGPSDFEVMGEEFVNTFEILPPVVRSFFLDTLVMTRCDATSKIYDALRKSGKDGSADFCQKIRDAWTAPKEPQRIVSRSEPDVIVL